MRFIRISLLLLFLTPFCLAQDPLPVVKSAWEPAIQKAKKVEVGRTGPARQLTVDDTLINRTNRAAMTDHPQDPAEISPDGRRAAIEKIEQESNTASPTDVHGFTYSATVRNDSPKVVKVIYWEYRFSEISNPANVGRRQFLCSVNLKKGAEMDLSAFTTLGPTDTVTPATLAPSTEPKFDGKVRVNRIEYSDDDVLQRGDWKLSDVKAAVDRATSTPWGKEVCRPL